MTNGDSTPTPTIVDDSRTDEEVATDRFVTALLTASRVLVGVSAMSLAAVEEKVTVTQFRTLVVLDGRGPTNLNGLAEALDVNSSTALRMIDRLLVTGLVTRRENPSNRREVVLTLTPEGTELVAKVTQRRREAIEQIVTSMNPRQRSGLIKSLQTFADAAGEPAARGAGLLGW